MKICDLKELDFLNKLDDEKVALLNKYMDFTLEENKKFNLTSLDNNDDFIIKNILDSLLLVKYLNENINGKSFVDIGSGAGLPGIPLAIYYPQTRFYLLEPTNKRAKFLEKAISILGLKNAFVINKRAEILAREEVIVFDFATARAVANINILLELAMPLLRVGGEFIAYKGKNYVEEAKSINSALNELNSSNKLVVNCELPFTNDVRSFVFFEKKGEISKKYPRNYSLIKKRPL